MYNTNMNPTHHPTPDKKIKKTRKHPIMLAKMIVGYSSKILGQNSKLFVKPNCAVPYTAHKNEVFH